MSGQLKVPRRRDRGDEEFGEYGFNSISLTELASRLGDRFGVHLAPTVFLSTGPWTSGGGSPRADPPPRRPGAGRRTARRGGRALRRARDRRAPGRRPWRAQPIAVIGNGWQPPAGTRPMPPSGTTCTRARDWRYHGDTGGPRWDARSGGGPGDPARQEAGALGWFPRRRRPVRPAVRRHLAPRNPHHGPAAAAPLAHPCPGRRSKTPDTRRQPGRKRHRRPDRRRAERLRQPRHGRAGGERTATPTVSGSVGPNRVELPARPAGPASPWRLACSSSLVALHTGVEAAPLEAAAASRVVGGVNTIVSPDLHIGYSRGACCARTAAESSPRGPTDARARRGRRRPGPQALRHARRDGDRILGVIAAALVSHPACAAAPTRSPRPTRVPRRTSSRAPTATPAWTPRTVTYVRAHGTGTTLGDPVELNSLKSPAFGEAVRGDGGHARPLDAPARCGLARSRATSGTWSWPRAGRSSGAAQMRHATLVETCLRRTSTRTWTSLTAVPRSSARGGLAAAARRSMAGHCRTRAGVSSFGFGGVQRARRHRGVRRGA
ncbi:phosphopantetheine-binding protein [Streptomyces thinghirensis]|nr:phosphopantetheine-binding protein [Streptomyces thinghirensis]